MIIAARVTFDSFPPYPRITAQNVSFVGPRPERRSSLGVCFRPSSSQPTVSLPPFSSPQCFFRVLLFDSNVGSTAPTPPIRSQNWSSSVGPAFSCSFRFSTVVRPWPPNTKSRLCPSVLLRLRPVASLSPLSWPFIGSRGIHLSFAAFNILSTKRGFTPWELS